MSSTARRYAYYQNRPWVTAKIHYGYNHVIFTALLDSGADTTVLGKGDALSLKLPWQDGKQVSIENPDGSVFQGREFQVELEVADLRFPVRVIFSENSVVDPPLLGRADVFDHFVISFHQKQGYVELKPVAGRLH